MEDVEKQIGMVFGTIGTNSFKVAITDPCVKRNDYVQMKHSECGDVLGQILDVQRETD